MDIQPSNTFQNIQEEEEATFSVQSITVQLAGQSVSHELQGHLFIFQDGYKIVCSEENNKTIFTKYSQTASFGTKENTLICFIDSSGGKQEEEYDEQESICDSLIKMIKEQKTGNFCLQGNLTMHLGFKSDQLGDMKECYQKMSEYLGQIDEGTSQYDENEEFEEMINANDIDEDGNIIKKSEDYSDESEQQKEQK